MLKTIPHINNHKLRYANLISHIIETLAPLADKAKMMKKPPLFKSVQDTNFREVSIHKAVKIVYMTEEKAIMVEE